MIEGDELGDRAGNTFVAKPGTIGGVSVPVEEEVGSVIVSFCNVGSFSVFDDLPVQVLCFITVHDDEIVAPP